MISCEYLRSDVRKADAVSCQTLEEHHPHHIDDRGNLRRTLVLPGLFVCNAICGGRACLSFLTIPHPTCSCLLEGISGREDSGSFLLHCPLHPAGYCCRSSEDSSWWVPFKFNYPKARVTDLRKQIGSCEGSSSCACRSCVIPRTFVCTRDPCYARICILTGALLVLARKGSA